MAKEKNESAPKKAAAAKKVPGPAKKSAPVKAMAAAAALPAVSASSPQLSPAADGLYEEIRLLAYRFYCERGGQHGSHDDDWRRAELEVRARYGK